MDTQDQTKIAQPGHDSQVVHHCPKCGWAFPNSHPSAKHRRAHNRVCPKIKEGDEHNLSDEDPETPSPKIVTRSRSGNVGIGGLTSRSEDELFADAVTEFPDAEFGLISEEGSLEKVVEDCLPTSESITDAVISDVAQLPKDSRDNSKSQSSTAFESGLRIILPHGHATSLGNEPIQCLNSEIQSKDSVVELSNDSTSPKDSMDNNQTQSPTASESRLRVILPHDHTTSLDIEPIQSLNSEIRPKDPLVELSNDKTSLMDSRDSNQTESPKAFEIGLEIILPHDHPKSLDIKPMQSLNSEIQPKDSVVEHSNDKVSPKSAPIIPETKDDGDMESEAKENKETESMSPKITMLEGRVPSENINSTQRSDSDLRAENSAVEPHNIGKNSRHYSIKSETADASKQNLEVNINDNVAQCLMSCNELVSNAKENKEAEGNLLHTTVLPKKIEDESFVENTSLQGMEKKLQCPLLVDRIVRSNEEHGDNLGCRMSPSHHLLEAESFQHSDGKFPDAVTAEVDPVQEINVGNVYKMVEGIIMSEGVSKHVHVLSVPDNIPFKDDPVTMHEDLKDHKSVELDLLQTSHSGQAAAKEDDINAPASKLTFLSIQSGDLGEFTGSSSVDACALEDSLTKEDGGCKATVEVASAETGSDSSEFKAACSKSPLLKSVEGSMASALAEAGSEISHKVCSHGEEQFHKVQNCSEQTILPEEAIITLIDKELLAVDQASGHGKNDDGMWECDTVEKNDKEVAAGKKLVVGAIETSEDVKLVGDERGKGSTDKNSKMDPTVFPKSANYLDDSQPVNDGISVKNPEEIDSTYVDGVLDLSRAGIIDPTSMDYMMETDSNLHNLREKEIPDGIKDVNIHSNNEDRAECVGVSTDAKSNQDLNVETLQESSESIVINKAILSPAVAEFSDQSISAIEVDKQCREVNVDASGKSSEFFQDALDSNFVIQQLGASAVDTSVDSSSQTGSLEGNWGSVSVGSLQSDPAAVADPKALSSNNFKDPVGEEKANLMKKQTTLSRGNHHKKSESFEPPSFMTLVEPKAVADPKADSLEILTAQNLQESDLSLQAAWFPSLTHVPKETMGRKKNEEVIAKVTNWSTGQQQHSNLKSLLGEAKSPNHAGIMPPLTGKDEEPSEKEKGSVDSISKPDMSPEAPMSLAARVEAAKEWDSPARYPAAIKRDKKKLKSKPYWAQFVCCSSVN